MWTLEGLGALDAALVREQMKDPNPRMRIQALRASESLYKAGDRTLDADYRAMAKDPDTDVAIQALLTLRVLQAPDLAEVVKGAQSASSARGVKEIGNFLLAPAPAVAGGAALSPEELKVIEEGTATYQSVCASCHAPDGRGVPLAGGAPGAMMAPSLAGSPRVNGHRDYVINVLLKGMTGPLGEGSGSSADIMLPMGSKHRRVGRVDCVLHPVELRQRRRSRHAGRRRARARVDAEPPDAVDAEGARRRGLPRRLESQPAWKVTASHASENAPIALSARAWNSGAPQAPGMWFQIELPQPVDGDRGRVRFTGAGRTWRRWRRPRWRAGRGRGGAGRSGDSVSARLSRRGLAGRQGVGQARRRGQGARRAHEHHVRAGPRQVRAHHADRHGRGRAELGDGERAPVRAGTWEVDT